MKNFLFSSKNNLNDVVFENRNKLYGAYQLRNDEAKILQKSLFIGISVFASIVAVPAVLNSIGKDKSIERKVPTIYDIVNVTTPERQEQHVIAAHPVQARATSENKDFIPQPKAHISSETHVITTQTTQNLSGNLVVNQNSTAQTGEINNTSAENTTPVIKVPEIKPTKTVDNTPHDKVDVTADFTGGIETFRRNIQQNFEGELFDGYGETLQTKITFIVEKDGSISNVKASGANEDFNIAAARAVKSIRGKWKPAKVAGENVRSYFSVPITMNF